jgi:hypothetical protein
MNKKAMKLGRGRTIEDGSMISILIGAKEKEILKRLGRELGRSAFIREAIRSVGISNREFEHLKELGKLRNEVGVLRNEVKREKIKVYNARQVFVEHRKSTRCSITEFAKEKGWAESKKFESFAKWLELEFSVDEAIAEADFNKNKTVEAEDNNDMYI